MRRRAHWMRMLALVAVVALVGAACDNDDDDAPEESEPAGPATLAVTATDDGAGGGYAFDTPASVVAGATRISLDNTGAEQHHAQLFKLNADATMDDLGAQLATGNPAALLEVGAFTGGTSVVEPGSTSAADAVVDLTPGTFVFMCFLENAEGLPHVAAGMLQPFEVTENDEPPALPDATGTISLVDYGYELPDSISGGDTLTIANRSEAEPHEMVIARLAEGVSAEDALAALAALEEDGGAPEGPPPLSPVGGIQALLPGSSQILQLDVDPGEYLVACFIPSVIDGVPHVEKGMVAQVTVT